MGRIGGGFLLLGSVWISSTSIGCSSQTDDGEAAAGQAGGAGSGGSMTATAGATTDGVSGSAGAAGTLANGGGAAGQSTGGAAGDAAAGGNAGAAVGGASGEEEGPVSSTGCGSEVDHALGEYVRFELTVGDVDREYFIRLPDGYDPEQPYPTAFLWTGCGGGGQNGIPLFDAEGAELIAVGPTPPGSCFESSPGSIDVDFFDAMLEMVKASYCVDERRVFTAGHSSGSWMSNVLGCTRSDVLRAQGNIAGGFPGNENACIETPIAAMLIHDEDDQDNGIEGSVRARDRLLELNGCSTVTMPVDPEPCVEYQGCTSGYPVVWCQTTGQGHSRQDQISVPGIWNFFSRF